MQKSTFNILFVVIACMWLSIIYMVEQFFHIPGVAALFIGAVITVPIYSQLRKSLNHFLHDDSPKDRWAQLLILAVWLAWMVRTLMLAPNIHGSNDAVGMWNYYARFLAGGHWQALFSLDGYYAPSHPMGLPSFIACIWNVLGHRYELVPVAISILATLLIPMLVFLETWKLNRLLSIGCLLLFALDRTYHGYGYAQLADLPLSLCFLGAFIAMHSYLKHRQQQFLFLVAGLLGCALWIKNEGLLLALLFLLFYAREWWRSRAYKQLIAGILPFAIALFLYKIGWAAGSGILQGSDRIWHGLTAAENYLFIGNYFLKTINNNFYPVAIGFILYFLMQLIRREWPAKNVMVIFCCMMAMLGVYLITPTELDWQLGTSLVRVIYELEPAMIYALIIAFSAAKWQTRSALA